MGSFMMALGIVAGVAFIEVAAEVVAELSSDTLLATVDDWFLYGGAAPDPNILSEADRRVLEQLSAAE
jgi:hypothetical protein